MERALSQGKYTPSFHIDISNSKINCLNFSDTVIFWTNDNSDESIKEILAVSHMFNWQAIDFFPVRGSIVYGEIFHADYRQPNGGGGIYNVNSVFGNGIVLGHNKSESQNWAGTVVDETLTSELLKRGFNLEEYLSPFAKKYKVPYKEEVDLPEEFVYWIVKRLDKASFKIKKERIERSFANHNKKIDNVRVQAMLKNTIKFLASSL